MTLSRTVKVAKIDCRDTKDFQLRRYKGPVSHVVDPSDLEGS